MTDQSMMLGVPAGAEPVSERSLAEPPPVDPKPKRKREIAGRFSVNIDGEEYRIEMRETGLTVRRSGKHHVDTKPMREVVDFVTGQGRLPFDGDIRIVPGQERDPNEAVHLEGGDVLSGNCDHADVYFNAEHSNYYCGKCHKGMGNHYFAVRQSLGSLLECCIEFIAAHTMKVNDAKFQGRYQLAASALREQVDALAPGRVDEVLRLI